MSKLEDDLDKWANEAFTKADAWAAIKILCEVVGFGAVMAIAGVVISALFGPGGLAPASAGACMYMYKRCADIYSDLPTDQRKVIAKFARKLYGIIH